MAQLLMWCVWQMYYDWFYIVSTLDMILPTTALEISTKWLIHTLTISATMAGHKENFVVFEIKVCFQ